MDRKGASVAKGRSSKTAAPPPPPPRARFGAFLIILAVVSGLITVAVFVTGVPSIPDWLNQGVVREAPKPSAVQQTTDTPFIAPAEEALDPIDFVTFLTKIKDETLTELQLSEFISAHRGRRVAWEGYVRSVKEETSRFSQYRYVLVVAPAREPGIGGPLWMALGFVFLPETASKADLVGLAPDQKVLVSGLLDFGGNDYDSPYLRNARLERIYPL
jgi:hypothetical protein